MAISFIQLTELEFDEQYPLVPNPFNPDASWSGSNEQGCLFETYGEDYDFVKQQDPRTIWTMIDASIVSGFHFVDRLGYLISTVPVPDGVEIEVKFL